MSCVLMVVYSLLLLAGAGGGRSVLAGADGDERAVSGGAGGAAGTGSGGAQGGGWRVPGEGWFGCMR